MDYRDQILSFLNTNGPSVPTKVKNHIGKDTLMASAMLSELSSNGKVKISHVKIGSSPLYYLPQHKDQLQNFSSYLHEKEQKVYAELKEQKVMRDSNCDPLTQECLRSMKDFAVPLTVTFTGQQETFWKWYLLTDEEANQAIGSILQPKEQPKKIEPLPAKTKEEHTEKKEITEQSTETPVEEKKIEQASQKKEPTKTQKSTQKIETNIQKTIQQDHNDTFFQMIKTHCDNKNIEILSSSIIKKGKEIDLIVSFASAVGKVRYFCKAKNKKRINHDELSSAYLEASEHKLPVLFLAPGALTKKAEEYIQTKLKGVTFSQLS